jgi:hypothetical protein
MKKGKNYNKEGKGREGRQTNGYRKIWKRENVKGI